MCFVQAGIPVVVLETKQMYLEKGLGVVRGNWMRRVKKGKLKKKKFEKYMAMIKPTLDYKDFSNVLFFPWAVNMFAYAYSTCIGGYGGRSRF